MSNEAIGSYLLTLRERQKLDQKDVAKEVGMNRSQLSKIERGQVSPGGEYLVALVQALGGSLLHLAELVQKDAPAAIGEALANHWLDSTPTLNREQRRRIDAAMDLAGDEEFWRMLQQVKVDRSRRSRTLDFWKGLLSQTD